MIQTYRLRDEPEYAALVGVDDAAGIDLLIGRPGLVDRGLGAEVIRSFTVDVVFVIDDVAVALASPDERNHRSLRAFEKAGYTRGGTFDTPYGTREVVMSIRRADVR